MNNTKAGWMIGVAAFGMMAAALGNEVIALNDWSSVVTPAFVGKAMIHLGAVVGAFVEGKMIPIETK